MALEKYHQKRDFNKTPEPKSGKSTNKDRLSFVVQKHDASRLHYDFRLELEGVLKSWAVPKGPSLKPKDKRLAMMVEDHPFGYKDFEGIIPQGEYGGGTVIVWDQGWYEPIEPIKGKKAQEKHLLDQLEKGSLKVNLHGEKLNGEFALVHTGGMGENAWLLIKHDDDFAANKDVTKQDKSVLTEKTIAQMAKTAENKWTKNGKEKIAAKQPKAKRANGKKTNSSKDTVEVSQEANLLDTTKILKSAPKKSSPKKHHTNAGDPGR